MQAWILNWSRAIRHEHCVRKLADAELVPVRVRLREVGRACVHVSCPGLRRRRPRGGPGPQKTQGPALSYVQGGLCVEKGGGTDKDVISTG